MHRPLIIQGCQIQHEKALATALKGLQTSFKAPTMSERRLRPMFLYLSILFYFTLSLVISVSAKKTKPIKIKSGSKKCYDANMKQIPCPVDKTKLIIILSVIFGVVVLAIITWIAVIYWKKRRQQRRGVVRDAESHSKGTYKQLENAD
ncbi:hypothetical protein L218DRAFT_50564 [Marasmius fiardii PR-910]|nr:hypothetical protein L218DRAFT_50564 [Marasmius fiardii PR-910]